eukprot:gene9376-11518_t
MKKFPTTPTRIVSGHYQHDGSPEQLNNPVDIGEDSQIPFHDLLNIITGNFDLDDDLGVGITKLIRQTIKGMLAKNGPNELLEMLLGKHKKPTDQCYCPCANQQPLPPPPPPQQPPFIPGFKPKQPQYINNQWHQDYVAPVLDLDSLVPPTSHYIAPDTLKIDPRSASTFSAASVAPPPPVTLSSKVIGSWVDGSRGGKTYTQYDITITNNRGSNINAISIGTDATFRLRDAQSLWNMVRLSNGDLVLPAYQQTINAYASYTFGYILEGTQPANLWLSPPSPFALPIIGNLYTVLKDNKPYIALYEYYKKYGPIYQLKYGTTNTVVLSEYNTLKEAFIVNGDIFHERFVAISRKFKAQENITNSNGEIWKKLKNLVSSEILSNMKVKRYEPMVQRESSYLMDQFEEFAKSGEALDPTELVKDLAVSIHRIFRFGGRPLIPDFVPFTAKFMDVQPKEYMKRFNVLYKYVGEVVEKKLKEMEYENSNDSITDTTSNQPRPFLETIIMKYKSGELTLNQVIKPCTDLLIAGSDTAALAILWTIIALCNNSELQEKLYQELSTQLPEGQDAYYSQRSKTPYLNAVIKEVERKFTISPLSLPHVTNQDINFQGYFIPKGTQIIINIYATHMSEKHWDQPSQFKPERFIENEHLELEKTLVTFGLGPRFCLGFQFAEQQVYTILASLFRKYKFSRVGDEKINENGEMGTTLAPFPFKMNTTLSRKIQKVLDIRLDSEDLNQSLTELSNFYSNNSIQARRNLRNDIERRYLDINNQFLDQFTLLNKNIEDLAQDFEDIKKCSDDICDHLNSTNQVSSTLLNQAKKMFDDLKEVETKEEIINQFLKKFNLTEEEESALQKRDIDSTFYSTLDRLTEIQLECKRNLSSNQYQRATYEIQAIIGQHQEKAYRKLYSWIKEEARNTLQKEAPEITKGLSNALSALQARPLLLRYCLEDISTYRSKVIGTGFITALTLGGPNGVPRPIEINAHDPQRYLGDMLAWIHQTLASEFEILSLLLGKITIKIPLFDDNNQEQQQDNNHQNSTISHSTSDQDISNISEQIEPIHKVLSSSFESVSRPLSIRVEKILQSKPGVTVIYKMVSVLDFYSRIAAGITNNTVSKVSSIFNNLKSHCLSVFLTQIKDQFDKLERSPTIPGQDLQPTIEIKDSINKLNELITTFNGSLIPVEDKEKEYTPVFSSIIQKIINLCTLSATRASKLPLISAAVFMINCLSLIQNVLSIYDFSVSNVEMLVGQIEAHMDTLVEEQTAEILQLMGIGQKLSILQYSESKTPLSQIPGMDRMSMVQAIRQFDTSIESSFGSLVMTNCEKISNAKLRAASKRSVSKLISTAYSSLYSNIMDPFNQYDDPHSIFQYKPEQINTMLDV